MPQVDMLLQTDSAKCHRRFSSTASGKGSKSNKEWCEVDTSDDLKVALETLGFVGCVLYLIVSRISV
jgi:hypothetical protein